MTPAILKWIIIISATMNFGFMAYDGTRALTIGDYIRPKTGDYAGQLGPWKHIATAVGIDPESNLMKILFVCWGVAGLFCTVCFALDIRWAWSAMLIVSISAVWYLIPGTFMNLLQIVLLLIIKFMK